MVQTSKGKAPAASTANPGDESKMASGAFFDQLAGAKMFYKLKDNSFWSERYTKSSFVNG